MSGRRHSWTLRSRFPERTYRECRRCGLVKVTVRELDAPSSAPGLRDGDGNLMWTEFYSRDGGLVEGKMPACAPAESEAT